MLTFQFAISVQRIYEIISFDIKQSITAVRLPLTIFVGIFLGSFLDWKRRIIF